jgi:hypothetical protein
MEIFFVAGLLGSISAVAAMLAIWLALGGERAIWRAILAIAGVSAAGLALCAMSGEAEAEWLVLVWVVAANVAALMLPVRTAGYRLASTAGNRAKSGEMQFSVRQLLALTAVVAVVVAAARLLAPTSATAVFIFLAISLCLGAVALVAVWATLRSSLTPIKTAALVVLSAVMAGLVYYGMEATNADPGEIWGGAVILYTIALAGMLLVVRARGFRLLHIAEAGQQQPAAPVSAPSRGLS